MKKTITCQKCLQTLSLENFRVQNGRWYGLICKKCKDKSRIKWRKKNLEKDRATIKKSSHKRRFGMGREEILKRFQYTCQDCGLVTLVELKLHVHHRDSKGRACKVPNNKIDNLTILCDSCHHSLHAKQIRRDKNGKFTSKKE